MKAIRLRIMHHFSNSVAVLGDFRGRGSIRRDHDAWYSFPIIGWNSTEHPCATDFTLLGPVEYRAWRFKMTNLSNSFFAALLSYSVCAVCCQISPRVSEALRGCFYCGSECN